MNHFPISMESIPSFVSVTFVLVALATLCFLFYALLITSKDRKDHTPTIVLALLSIWIFLVCLGAFNGFYRDYESVPPRLIFLIGPAILTIIGLVVVKRTRDYLMKLPLTTLTYIHIIRVPVEIVLWWLAGYGVVSTAMTFEGINYDILSGISAPFAGIFLVGSRSKSRIGAILWNLVALALLVNIVIHAIAASPWFFDPSANNVPNIAVLYFPYVLLPALVVPIVFFAHTVSLIKLFGTQEESY